MSFVVRLIAGAIGGFAGGAIAGLGVGLGVDDFGSGATPSTLTNACSAKMKSGAKNGDANGDTSDKNET